MADANDMDLVREFARHNSQTAFAELVRHHLNLVYSVALRFTANPGDAEEVAQAVFIILARKAAGLSARTVLTGWLYETTRFTAIRLLRTRARRQAHEQEAFMQSTLNQPGADNVWRQLAPHLEAGMSRLAEHERTLLALRFYENKTGAEAAAQLGIREDAAYKRTARALEKLRKFFTKRGVSSTTAILAGAISANSVQAAPVALAKSVTAVAIAKGAAASASTLTLIKGTLKIMAWTKMKTAIAAGAVVLLGAGAATVAVEATHGGALKQRLASGSVLVLNKVLYGDKLELAHKGKTLNFDWQGHEGLVLEFSVTGQNAENDPLVKPAFYRQFRCVIHGETGIEYIEEFFPPGFKKYSDGFFNCIETSIFPRDSRWLWFRVEESETNNPYGPWQTVAEFKVANPARPAKLPWVATPAPTTNTVDGMDFVLSDVTVETRPYTPRDIWNHVITLPTEVFDNGVLLTNWGAAYVQLEDASGNYDPILQKHRSLDPGYVWKLDMDFEPGSDFQNEDMATVKLPGQSAIITTNVMNIPVTISWNGTQIGASIPTNNPDIALKFISATDDQGETMRNPSGGGSRYQFREGYFMTQRGGIMTMNVNPTKVTLAVVPNVHTTFYVQPRLIAK